MRSYAYKTTPGGYDLSMDVYLPDETKFGVVAALALQLAKGKSLEDASHALPVLLYWHGGGLTAGSRATNAWFPHWLLSESRGEEDAGGGELIASRRRGCAGGRLLRDLCRLHAPQPSEVHRSLCTPHAGPDRSLAHSSGQSLVEDAKDCVAFIATGLNDLLGLTTSHLIDPARIVVAGSSAGGWMASM